MHTDKEKKNKSHKTVLMILCTVFLLLLSIGVLIVLLNEYTLTIHLKGPREINLEFGEHYEEPGYYVTRKGSLLLKEDQPYEAEVLQQGTVDPEVLGEYTLTYTATSGKLTAEATRIVRIVDTEPPVITLDEDAPIPIFVPGEPYVDNSYSATDNYDGDLTQQVMILERQGQLQYSVSDSSGNETVVIREVPEYDPLPPQIHLEGGADYHIRAGHIYEEPGYTATDDFIGEITERVETEGEVNWYTPGEYPLTYHVSDDYGNVTTVTRTVTVEAAARPEQLLPQGKVVYLTFDDGPGPYTDGLLDVLNRYGAKATFFVVGNSYPEQMRRIVAEGHSIAVHSVTHNYRQIYASPEAYFQDILGEQEIIRQNTGVETTLMRFPGGSSNLVSSFNKGIMTTLTEAVQNAGFQYFDWNVDSMDAGGARTAKQVRDNVIAGIRQHRVSVVLQHDIHPYSVAAVESILQWGQTNGYQFLALQPDSFGARHGVNN